jgi:tyrosyl-tRNA synthetase
MGLAKQVVMVMPILVGLDGSEKMSKSKGNYVGVCDAPADMFGKVMSIPDRLMPDYYKLLTNLPSERIQSLVDPQQTHPREAKDILARVLVEELYDRQSANAASDEFRRRFSEGQLPTDLVEHRASASPIGILKLLAEVGFAASNSEARRLVEQGAVTLDDLKVSDTKAQVALDAPVILRVGKRRVVRVTK